MLEAKALRKSFGGLAVIRDISLKLEPGARHVILGPNGAGKTTLFNLLAGTLAPSAGDILLDDSSIRTLSVAQRAQKGLSRSYQKNNLFEDLSIRDNLMLAAAASQDKSTWMIKDSFADHTVRETAVEIAEQLTLTDQLDQPVQAVAYGTRRRLEVGLALATKPRILLMDEPTSGVGPSMIEDFHRLLQALPQALMVLIIEHDMDLAFAIADRVTVLNFGEVVFEGTPEEARGSPTVRTIYLGDWQGHA